MIFHKFGHKRGRGIGTEENIWRRKLFGHVRGKRTGKEKRKIYEEEILFSGLRL